MRPSPEFLGLLEPMYNISPDAPHLHRGNPRSRALGGVLLGMSGAGLVAAVMFLWRGHAVWAGEVLGADVAALVLLLWVLSARNCLA